MNDFERGDEITLDDNSKYIVVDSFEMNNKHYLYLLLEEDKKTISVVELENDEIIKIHNEEELDLLYNELIERNKDEINKYLEEINEN